MPIRIIDKNFDFVGEIDDYESLIFIRRFFKVGEFELHINVNKLNTDKLVDGNLIILDKKRNKIGIIMHRENAYDQNGEPTDILVIKGPTSKGMLSRRLIVPPENSSYAIFTGVQETIMKQIVFQNCISPVDASRKIEKISLINSIPKGVQDKWRSRYENVADKLTEIGEYSGLGWDLKLAGSMNQFYFDVIKGKTLTENQSLLPPVIFSIEFNSIKNRHYIESSLNHKNVAYVGGKGENENRLIQQVGEVKGFDRIETFIDCSEAEDAEEQRKLGQQKLNEFKKIKSFEVQIIPYSSFFYEKDYDLGDIVTVQDKKLGITMDARIIEIKEIYEVGGFNLEATFGTNIPNLLTDLKREAKKVVK